MNPVEQEIIRLVHARSEALVKSDVDAMRAILHPDFVYVNAGGYVSDRESYLGRFVDPDDAPTWELQDVSEISVRIFGDMAIANCRVHDVATWKEHRMDASFRSTFVYLNTPDGWQCVTGHTSPLDAE